MAIIKVVLLVLFLTSAAHASTLADAFKNRDYKTVTALYLQSPKKRWTYSEMIKISYSLRKRKQYRHDISLSLKILNSRFKKKHREVIREVRKDEMLETENYSKAMKILYWNIFKDYANLIKQDPEKSAAQSSDLKMFNLFYKVLTELEFREDKINDTNDEINALIKKVKDSVYRFSSSISIQYVSWQRDAGLYSTTSDDKFGLIITNKGYCLGGDLGLENEFHHFYGDGCLLLGSGGVSSYEANSPTYKQSAVPAYGFKGGPGYSMIVSSSKSRIGFKIPFIYTVQDLEAPKDKRFSIDSRPQIDVLFSLYSRWHLDKWFFQTEFGTYFQKEESFWGLGIGRAF